MVVCQSCKLKLMLEGGGKEEEEDVEEETA
jgi:hypothetical protein